MLIFTTACLLYLASAEGDEIRLEDTVEHAYLSNVVYNADGKLVDGYEFEHFASGVSYKVDHWIENNRARGMLVTSSEGVCIVVAQGTNDTLDWVTANLRIRTSCMSNDQWFGDCPHYEVFTGPRSHALATFTRGDTLEIYNKWLSDCTNHKLPVSFTGHSLGGAVAMNIALMTKHGFWGITATPIDQVVTFGQTRVFFKDSETADCPEDWGPDKVIRVARAVTYSSNDIAPERSSKLVDIAPLYPPAKNDHPWCSFGLEVTLNEDGSATQQRFGGDWPSSIDPMNNQQAIGDWLSLHSMKDSYYEGVRRMWDQKGCNPKEQDRDAICDQSHRQ